MIKTMSFGNAMLTTDNPSSSYGLPVLIFGGKAYGPDDMLDGFMAGSHIMTSDRVTMQDRLTPDEIEFLSRWLLQSPANGKRWIARLQEIA